MSSETLTPMMQQYQSIRRSLPTDTILMYRLGDFFEMFFEDAKEASALCNLALTKRGQTPMCGVPAQAADGYIAKLVAAGKRVAICDQIGDAQPGKIVKREITQVISPGTIADLNLLDAKRNNYLAAVFEHKGVFGFAFVDTSTGEFRLTELPDATALEDELARVAPAETLIADDQQAALPAIPYAVPCDGYLFLPDHAGFTLRDHFKVQSLDGFGCSGMTAATGAAGAILHYLKHQMRRQAGNLLTLSVYRNSGYLTVDAVTQSNLELVTSRGTSNMSLLNALDRTMTPMGGRLLRHWILHPLRELAPLVARQQTIADLLEDAFLLSKLRETLKSIRDIERTMGRLSAAGGNARDLLALKTSLDQLPELRAHLAALLASKRFGASDCAARSLAEQIHAEIVEFPELTAELARALVDEPPLAIKEGGIFRDGFNPQLDELRAACREGKDWIAALQQQEIEATGIKSLKVRFTSVFGYFIEITKANLGSVPERYHRKQTTVNGERFITPELKEMEGKILGADERSKSVEYELFGVLRERVLDDLIPLQQTAAAIASLDAIASLAETARLFGYCRPVLSDGLRLSIADGRHPVLDQSLVEEKFVPNDVELDGTDHRLHIITGPNMAGKSTYIRQVALIVLMAQIGSFVPASHAEIGLVDRIFTRVGANDDLSRGQSTFMVEMNETANILNNATERSLVILDEIGRGTSTFDGLSIAWSVAEFLHDAVGARTLFATHYHELTDLEVTRPGVKNYNVAVREWNDQIIFLRKIVRGGADKSYGIQVARLAGLPGAVLDRAKEILGNLELAELNADGKPKIAETPSKLPRVKKKTSPPEGDRPQMALF
ncbi:MAG: DNA mismatch repair protein MutS [Verrucomicrobia bacterium]|nr:DNA mismatch repair protein MutS [Verrucomicrobiota bacterium]